MNLRATASFSTAILVILLVIKAYPVLSPNAFSRKASELQLVETSGEAEIKAPEKHRRPVDQTFLTFPEWFLVFSPEEFARFTQGHEATNFPFFGHIVQFWQGYGAVSQVILGRYPFNPGYHVMVMVIGTSTTAEYLVRGVYESVVGRLTGALGPTTDEDRFTAEYAKKYVDFIRIEPWYKFDFVGELKYLWRETSLLGANPIRKWERKYYLTTELLGKAAYGWLIKLGTQAAYDPTIDWTAVVVDRLPEAAKECQVLEKYPDGSALVLLPRYAAFADTSSRLAREGVSFREVAGNQGSVVLSILAPSSERFAVAVNQVILTQPILTERPLMRFVIAVPIRELGHALKVFSSAPFTLEHVFDF